MKNKTSLSILFLMLSAVLIAGCAGSSPSPSLNFGDGSIGNLWYHAQSRKAAGDLDQALIYADKIIELHSPEARKMQASLTDYPPTKDIYYYDSLNGVGRTLLFKGNVLIEKGDAAGAKAALNTLINDYSFAQYEDVGKPEKLIEDARRKLRGL